jgi:hypothetical protein
VLPGPDATPEPGEGDGGGRAGKGREGRLDLNVPQVAGSAVAAVVAAKLASNLGVYGTIAGAGVVSVLGTCGGSILQHFFRRTGRHMQEVAVQARPGVRRVRGDAPTPAGDGRIARTVLLPEARPADPADPTATRPLTSALPLPGPAAPADGEFPGAVAAGDPAHVQEARQDGNAHPATSGYGAPTAYRARRRGGWKRPAAAVALAFGLTMVGITGYEAVAGENISGHGHGTTIGNAVTGHSSSHSGGGTTPGTGDTPSTGTTSSPFGSDSSGRPRRDTTPTASRPTETPSQGSGTGTSTGGGTTDGGTHTTPTPTSPPPTSADPSPSATGTPGDGTAGGGTTDGFVTP